MSEGILLANYSFDRLKNDSLKDNPTVLLSQVVFIGLDAQEDKHFAKWQTIAKSVHLVRDLVNGNADDVTPKMLARYGSKHGKKYKGTFCYDFGEETDRKREDGAFPGGE